MADRYGVLWCPHWPVVAAGCAIGEAAIVVRANRVVAHSAAAADSGVVVGMRRRQAQSRCPHARMIDHDPDHDARRFDRVVQVLADHVPRLDVAEPGLLAFAAKGPTRYFGRHAGSESSAREAAMLVHLLGVANAAVADSIGPHVGPHVSLFVGAVADGRFAATTAARRVVDDPSRAALVVVPADSSAAYLAPLPVHVLAAEAVPVEMIELFVRLGLRTLGQLAALPIGDVMARFGHPGVFAHRLASGRDDRPASTVDPSPSLQIDHALDDAVHQVDTLVFIGRQLAGDLGDRLSARGQVCTRLLIAAETEHGERCERVWYRSAGLSVAAMVERLRWQLDAWVAHADLTAGVTSLHLQPLEVHADDGVQLGLWGGRTQADEWAVRAVARLATVAGEQQVLVPVAAGGRLPGDAYRWVPATTVDLLDDQRFASAESGAPWPGRLPSPSPAVVYAAPLAAVVVDAADRPVQVSGRGLVSQPPAAIAVADATGRVGRPEPVVAWSGPWPLEERWWDAATARRSARFQMQVQSGRLLLVGLERQRWSVLAEYQ